MFTSPWMLVGPVPLGFLAVAGLVAWRSGGWNGASSCFVGFGLFCFCVGIMLVSGPIRTSAPSRSRIVRFARRWLRWYPATSEADLRAILGRRFSGTGPSLKPVAANAEADSDPAMIGEGGCLVSLLAPGAMTLRHRFFPEAPAEPVEIAAVLAELRDEGYWSPESAGQ